MRESQSQRSPLRVHESHVRIPEPSSPTPATDKVKIFEDPDFISTIDEFKSLNPKIMESFYRKMRTKTGFLMENGKPIDGKWNFDALNRGSLPKIINFPVGIFFEPDEITRESIAFVRDKFANNFGDIEPFNLAINRQQALQSLEYFVQNCLINFGNYQDAMKCGENLLFHSGLSQYMNIGLLSPFEVCKRAEKAYFSFPPIKENGIFNKENLGEVDQKDCSETTKACGETKKTPHTQVLDISSPRYTLGRRDQASDFIQIQTQYEKTRSIVDEQNSKNIHLRFSVLSFKDPVLRVSNLFSLPLHSQLISLECFYSTFITLIYFRVCLMEVEDLVAVASFLTSNLSLIVCKNNLITIENVEGFIRQIIGWREFIRGVYWTHMPEYGELNHLNASEPLPDFYWTGETDMRCLRECILQTKTNAYSHHIQRLMVTGNFANLIGVNPAEIHEWYLKVYADAHEWVEMPNTLGMALYADGGIVGTKPYICSANYINKMSDFCKGCKYNHKDKTTENACPFNYLYWNFMIKHDFSKNPRMFTSYLGLSKMSEEENERLVTIVERIMKRE